MPTHRPHTAHALPPLLRRSPPTPTAAYTDFPHVLEAHPPHGTPPPAPPRELLPHPPAPQRPPHLDRHAARRPRPPPRLRARHDPRDRPPRRRRHHLRTTHQLELVDASLPRRALHLPPRRATRRRRHRPRPRPRRHHSRRALPSRRLRDRRLLRRPVPPPRLRLRPRFRALRQLHVLRRQARPVPELLLEHGQVRDARVPRRRHEPARARALHEVDRLALRAPVLRVRAPVGRALRLRPAAALRHALRPRLQGPDHRARLRGPRLLLRSAHQQGHGPAGPRSPDRALRRRDRLDRRARREDPRGARASGPAREHARRDHLRPRHGVLRARIEGSPPVALRRGRARAAGHAFPGTPESRARSTSHRPCSSSAVSPCPSTPPARA